MKTFAKSTKEEGEEVQKIVEKICYLRRNTFADDPFNVSLVVEVVPAILLATMPKISCLKKPSNLFLVSL